ncbi:uncharacterized protein LOC128305056 [Anopheles moucheti]|uniref:uncharacterized protein LOC128305056 n=1 Tax=Anopheles moucheti TaxID=186751 RepID=UPI0022F08C0F|nr:uncharacterized protein LOC128305056 [Anopheles moucheti]
MNCSCAAERCPHLLYLRTLLETSQKEQIPYASRQTSTSENVGVWQRWRPLVMRTIRLSGCVLETVMLLWVTITRFCLQLWLQLLDANRSALVLFLFFTVSLICSILGGVHGAVSR